MVYREVVAHKKYLHRESLLFLIISMLFGALALSAYVHYLENSTNLAIYLGVAVVIGVLSVCCFIFFVKYCFYAARGAGVWVLKIEKGVLIIETPDASRWPRIKIDLNSITSVKCISEGDIHRWFICLSGGGKQELSSEYPFNFLDMAKALEEGSGRINFVKHDT